MTCVCVHKQKTRLCRIRAVKNGGSRAYLQYKQRRLLIGLDEEVTTETQLSSSVLLVFLSLLVSSLFHESSVGTRCRLLHDGCFMSTFFSLFIQGRFSHIDFLSCVVLSLYSFISFSSNSFSTGPSSTENFWTWFYYIYILIYNLLYKKNNFHILPQISDINWNIQIIPLVPFEDYIAHELQQPLFWQRHQSCES